MRNGISSDSLLTLVTPAHLEEVLVDWLLEHAAGNGFCSGPINGHSARHDQLNLAEQVAGHQRQIRFEIHAEHAVIDGLLGHLRQDFAGASLHYWIAPLSGAGKI